VPAELDLDDDLRRLQDMVRRFVDTELIPLDGKSCALAPGCHVLNTFG
jgi:hypothetical protein